MKNILFRFYFSDRRQVDLIIIFREYINTLAVLRAPSSELIEGGSLPHFGQLSPVGNGQLSRSRSRSRNTAHTITIISQQIYAHLYANVCCIRAELRIAEYLVPRTHW